MSKVKVQWVRDDMGKLVGNLLGYATMNNMLKQYSEPYIERDENAGIALNLTPADFFCPIAGKKNVLMTMWEALDVPESYIRNMNDADLIVVPSRFCKEIFKAHTNKPIEVCWLGIEPGKFLFHQREFPFTNTKVGLVPKGEKRFRMLWLGAPNPRKGYFSIMEIVKVFEDLPQFEIYIKTTGYPKSTWREFFIINWRRLRDIYKHRKNKKQCLEDVARLGESVRRKFGRYVADRVEVMGKHKNIIVDMRKLPADELEQLYKDAHVFLSPHMGEGWNLPLSEAMATGLPCIATGVSGCMDFFDESVGYPIKYDIQKIDLQNYDLTARAFVPDTEDLVKRIFEVFYNYPVALRRGKKASERIHSKFTWEKAGKRLGEILSQIEKENGK